MNSNYYLFLLFILLSLFIGSIYYNIYIDVPFNNKRKLKN